MSRLESISRDYLHVLHGVFRHPFISTLVDDRLWDQACDIAVEGLICKPNQRHFVTKSEVARRAVADGLRKGVKPFSRLRYMMICGCGFPNSRNNFEPAVQQFRQCFPCNHAIITIPESPMFNAPEAVVTEPRLALVKQAGRQYAQTGGIDGALLNEIGSPMIPEAQYAAIVNGGM